jgi:hypothetical protein
MPYIAPELRGRLDNLIDDIWYICQDKEYQDKIDGVANYIISRLASALLDPKPLDWDYASKARVIGLFECAKIEAYRRHLETYEDSAILKNNDIQEYEKSDAQLRSKWAASKPEEVKPEYKTVHWLYPL